MKLRPQWKCRLCKRPLQPHEAPAAGEPPYCDDCLKQHAWRPQGPLPPPTLERRLTIVERPPLRPPVSPDGAAWAASILAVIGQTRTLQECPQAPEGACYDCDTPAQRFQIGTVLVCRHCGRQRLAAQARLAHDQGAPA